MEIILEYEIIDNFVIDWILLNISLKILKFPICKKRIALSCFLGTIFACVSPLIALIGAWGVAAKLLVAYFMCIIICLSFKAGIRLWIAFSGITFCFGGLLIAVFSYLNIPTNVGLINTYISPLPMGIILGGGVLFSILASKMAKIVRKRNQVQVLELNIRLNNKKKMVMGFVDTGNLLHSSSGRAVVVVEEDLLKFWLSDAQRMALFLKKFDKTDLSNIEQIAVNSMGATYMMTIFDADIDINGKSMPISLGISTHKLGNKDYKAIVGSEIVEVCNV